MQSVCRMHPAESFRLLAYRGIDVCWLSLAKLRLAVWIEKRIWRPTSLHPHGGPHAAVFIEILSGAVADKQCTCPASKTIWEHYPPTPPAFDRRAERVR